MGNFPPGFIDKQGYWYSRGLPATPGRALSQIDVVINALHGGVGEDGSVQRILERLAVPYTGSRALAAGLSLSKIRAHDILQKAGVPVRRLRRLRSRARLQLLLLLRVLLRAQRQPAVPRLRQLHPRRSNRFLKS